MNRLCKCGTTIDSHPGRPSKFCLKCRPKRQRKTSIDLTSLRTSEEMYDWFEARRKQCKSIPKKRLRAFNGQTGEHFVKRYIELDCQKKYGNDVIVEYPAKKICSKGGHTTKLDIHIFSSKDRRLLIAIEIKAYPDPKMSSRELEALKVIKYAKEIGDTPIAVRISLEDSSGREDARSAWEYCFGDAFPWPWKHDMFWMDGKRSSKNQWWKTGKQLNRNAIDTTMEYLHEIIERGLSKVTS